MKNKFVFFLIFAVVFSLSGAVVSAQTATTSPGLLPTSPFYFFKEFSRGLSSFFTFNPVAKAKLELKFADERAGEIEVLAEEESSEGVEKAIENYQENVARLKTRLQSLQGTSENPNIDELLGDLTERAIRHQQLFDELKLKHEQIRNQIEAVQELISESLGAGLDKLDLPEKIEARFEKALEKIDRPLADIESLSALSQLEGKLTEEEIKNKLLKFEEKLVSKFEGEVEAGKISLADLPSLIKELSQADDSKIRFLDFIRENISDNALKNQLNVLRQELFDEIQENDAISEEKAREEIEEARAVVSKVESLINNATSTLPVAVKQLFEQAKFNLEQAVHSLEAADYGRAFGQATSARAIAKNVFRKLTQSEEEIEDEIEEFKEDFDELKAEAREKGLTPENASQLFELFNQAETKIIQIPSSPSADLLKEVRALMISIEVLLEKQDDGEKDIEDEFEDLEKFEKEFENFLPSETKNQEWKVEIKEGRFNPPTLKVKKGDTVTWMNADGAGAWPASAVHPTHTVYPGSSIGKCGTPEANSIFDACKSLAKGESWSFVFNEIGTWKYHNHVLGGSTGVIEVEE